MSNPKSDIHATILQAIKDGDAETVKQWLEIAPKPAVPVAGDRMELTIKDAKYPFRWCPAGTFLMGSPPTEAERRDAGCSGDFVSTDIVSLAGQ